jgi:hypothetical protein
MTIQISVFALALIAFILNTILDHLFNWWFREISFKNEGITFLLGIVYLIKTALIIGSLYFIFHVQ